MNRNEEQIASTQVGRGTSAWLQRGAIGGTALAALLLLLAPMGGAASPHPATAVHSAPYLGMKVTSSQSWTKTGCGSSKVTTKPFFYPKTGMGGSSSYTVSKSCPAAMGGASASSTGSTSTGIDLTYKMTFLHKGPHTITAALNLSVGGHASLATGGCNPGTAKYYYCSAGYYGGVYGSAYLFDSTTGTYAYPTVYWGGLTSTHGLASYYVNGGWANSSSISLGPFFGSTVAKFSISAKITPSHSYFLLLDLSAGLYTYESGYSGGSALMVLNMSTHGNGAQLVSIVVT